MESPTGTKELMRSMEARANGFKQYSDQKKLYTWMLIGSIVLVPLSVYGGFFFGLVDRNFFSGVVGKGVLSARRGAIWTFSTTMWCRACWRSM